MAHGVDLSTAEGWKAKLISLYNEVVGVVNVPVKNFQTL